MAKPCYSHPARLKLLSQLECLDYYTIVETNKIKQALLKQIGKFLSSEL